MVRHEGRDDHLGGVDPESHFKLLQETQVVLLGGRRRVSVAEQPADFSNAYNKTRYNCYHRKFGHLFVQEQMLFICLCTYT